jgi:hypothetical protein
MASVSTPRPRRPRLWLAALIFLAAYLPLGYLFLDFAYASLETPGQLLMSLLIPAPVFMIAASSIWLYMPRPTPSPVPVSYAQVRSDRKALIAVVCFVSFVSLASLAVTLMSGKEPGLNAFAPLLVWMFLLRVYGVERMKYGMILVFFSSPYKDEADVTERMEQFMTGFILDRRKGKATNWTVRLRVDRSVHPPMIQAEIEGDPLDPAIDEKEVLSLSLTDTMALQSVLTDNADPYRLTNHRFTTAHLKLAHLSAHEKMSCLKTLSDTRKSLPKLFPNPQGGADQNGAPSPA